MDVVWRSALVVRCDVFEGRVLSFVCRILEGQNEAEDGVEVLRAREDEL